MDVYARFFLRRNFVASLALGPLLSVLGCSSPAPVPQPDPKPEPLEPLPEAPKEEEAPGVPKEELAPSCSIGLYGKKDAEDRGIAIALHGPAGERLVFPMYSREQAEALIAAVNLAIERTWPKGLKA